jgi:hypothetical protein
LAAERDVHHPTNRRSAPATFLFRAACDQDHSSGSGRTFL